MLKEPSTDAEIPIKSPAKPGFIKLYCYTFLYPPQDSDRVLWFHPGHPCVCPYIRQSFLVSFPDDNLSKHQWIFTKLGMCIDIVEILFGIANGQISSNLTELSARDIFSFLDDNLSKCQGSLTKLGTCIHIMKIWFGIANGQISSIFDRVICPRHNNGGYYHFTFLFPSKNTALQVMLSVEIWPSTAAVRPSVSMKYVQFCYRFIIPPAYKVLFVFSVKMFVCVCVCV